MKRKSIEIKDDKLTKKELRMHVLGTWCPAWAIQMMVCLLSYLFIWAYRPHNFMQYYLATTRTITSKIIQLILSHKLFKKLSIFILDLNNSQLHIDPHSSVFPISFSSLKGVTIQGNYETFYAKTKHRPSTDIQPGQQNW